MPTVYIETTIPSFYVVDKRSSPVYLAWQATQVWWDKHRHAYQLCTSTFVLDEIARSPEPKASAAAELLRDVPLLEHPAGLVEVIDHYIEHRLVPGDAAGDAAHLAIASMHSVDFLLTWNCQHLANANKIRHLRVLNGRLGLSVPTITTPLSMMPEPTT